MYTYPMDCKIYNNASFVKYTILSIIPTNIHEVIMLNVSKYWACNDCVPDIESHVFSTSMGLRWIVNYSFYHIYFSSICLQI